MIKPSTHCTKLLGLPGVQALACLVILAAATCFYSWAWSLAVDVGGDYGSYAKVASDLADGHLQALHIRPPGYPLLLLLTGATSNSTPTLFLAQIALYFVSVWLILVLIENSLRLETKLPIVAVLLCLPPLVEPVAYGLTEALSGFCIVVGLFLSTRSIQYGSILLSGVSGLAFGYAGITHPMFILVCLAPPVAWFALKALRWLPPTTNLRVLLCNSASLLCGAALPIAALVAYNGLHFGYWRPTPFTGYAFSVKTVNFLERLPDEFAEVREVLVLARDADLIKRNSSHKAGSYIWTAQAQLQTVTGLNQQELSDYLLKANVQLICDNPINYLDNVAHSAVSFWFPSCGKKAVMDSAILQLLWLLFQGIVNVMFWLVLPITLYRAWCLRRALSTMDKANLLEDSCGTKALFFYLSMTSVILYSTVIVSFFGSADPRNRRPVELLVFATTLVACSMLLKSDLKLLDDQSKKEKTIYV